MLPVLESNYNINMDLSQVARIIDANLNRTAEGLRLLEDVARLVLNDAAITEQLKTLRHELVRGDLPFNLELLQARDSAGDVGTYLEVEGEEKHKELSLIVVANSRRVQESLRVLEELAKLPETAPKLSPERFKKARFDLYTIEQKLLSRLTRQDKIKRLCGLYVVIDTQSLQGRRHLEAAREIIRAGVKVIQLRDKVLSKKELLPIAGEMQKLCSEQNVLFIVNDYLDIALAAGADGLHVGQDDLPVADARRLLPVDKILGCSVTTVEQAAAAETAGADYIACGAIFPTISKEKVEVVGLGRMQKIKQATKVPLVAIGGITLENIREVIESGACAAAVISAVLQAKDISRAARQMIERIEVKK